jgi:hypothetical protein
MCCQLDIYEKLLPGGNIVRALSERYNTKVQQLLTGSGLDNIFSHGRQ